MSGLIEKSSTIRRRLTASQKLAIIQESYAPGAFVSEVARKHRVGVSSLLKWRKHAIEGSLMSVKDKSVGISASEAKQLQKEVSQLRKLLGKKTLQVELLEDALAIAREKKLISRQPLPWENDTAND